MKRIAPLLAFAALPVFAQNTPTKSSAPIDTGDAHAAQALKAIDTPEQLAARLAWWNDARFGMFIHWGLYSQWGCHYPGSDGKLFDG